MSAEEPKSQGLDRGIDKLEDFRARREEARDAGELKGQRARGWTERLLTRTLSGAIYAVLTTACIFAGEIPTAILVAAMAWLCCSEFLRIARMAGRYPLEPFALTAALAYPLAMLFGGLEGQLIVAFLLLICVSVWYVLTPRATIGDVAISMFGPTYTSLAFSSLVLIRSSDPGLPGALLCFGLVISIWGNDAVAYFVGSRIGVHKLAPRISPHKSWEGFFAGLICCMLVWMIMGIAGLANLNPWLGLVCGLLIGVASVIGDLFESRVKRGVGVKDSGNFMPGHGGMLDRSDSLIFASMVALFLLHIGGVL